MKVTDEIVARRDAVNRIARRAGHSIERAEDIAQRAALQLLENANLKSQSNKQAYIDAFRTGGESFISRAGIFTQPIYEGHFKDYANFVAQVGSGFDLENESIDRRNLSDIVSALSVLKPRSRLIWELYYDEDLSMDEISKRFGLTESRVSQLLKLSREQIKKAIMSSRLSQQEQRARKFQELQSISREIQTLGGVQREAMRNLACLPKENGLGVVSFKIAKIPKELFVSF